MGTEAASNFAEGKGLVFRAGGGVSRSVVWCYLILIIVCKLEPGRGIVCSPGYNGP